MLRGREELGVASVCELSLGFPFELQTVTRRLACRCRRPVNSAPNIFVKRNTMGVEGCTKCIKYMLFFFNFIFWVRSLVFFSHIVVSTSLRSASSSLSSAVLVCLGFQPVMNELWLDEQNIHVYLTSPRCIVFTVINLPPQYLFTRRGDNGEIMVIEAGVVNVTYVTTVHNRDVVNFIIYKQKKNTTCQRPLDSLDSCGMNTRFDSFESSSRSLTEAQIRNKLTLMIILHKCV